MGAAPLIGDCPHFHLLDISRVIDRRNSQTPIERPPMYHHVKKLMYTVHVDDPDPRFGNMLLEQFGGANGELAAAMQYSIQGSQL